MKNSNHGKLVEYDTYMKKNLMIKIKDYKKIRDHHHFIGHNNIVANCVCILSYVVPKEYLVILHSRRNYDFYLMVKICLEILHKMNLIF